MINYTKSDGGREAAGFKGKAGDCVTRALAHLTGVDYRTCYNALAKAHAATDGRVFGGRVLRRTRSARNGVDKVAYDRVFKEWGLEKVRLPKGPRPTYTEAHETYGDCICSTTKHLVAIVDGSLLDTFDGRTYLWEDEWGGEEERERKAASVWTKPRGWTPPAGVGA